MIFPSLSIKTKYGIELKPYNEVISFPLSGAIILGHSNPFSAIFFFHACSFPSIDTPRISNPLLEYSEYNRLSSGAAALQ